MTWNPTHRVPDAGLQSYIDNQPAAMLAPGLEVEVAEWSGSWARVIASNGWECWVDGGELVPVAAAAAPMAAAAATGPHLEGTTSTAAASQPPAGSAPPPAYVPPAQAAEQPTKRSGPPWIPILIGVIILLLIVGGAGGGYLFLNANAADVTLEQSSQQSAQPFQPSVTAPSTAPSASPSAAASAAPTAAPPKGPNGVAIYGGSGNNRICDKQKLIDFLTTHPSEAAAWASVEGISTAQIPDFIRQLSPEILSQDVRVTNHGFSNGRATTYQSVFQAGTAVLVNQYGYPVVRCLCGNPLTPPTSNQRVRYTGNRWPGFNQTTIIIYVAPPGNVPNVPTSAPGGGIQLPAIGGIDGRYTLNFQRGVATDSSSHCSADTPVVVIDVKSQGDTSTISVVSATGMGSGNTTNADLNKLLGGTFKTSDRSFKIGMSDQSGTSLFEGKFDGNGGVTGHYLLKISLFGEAPSGCDSQFTGKKA